MTPEKIRDIAQMSGFYVGADGAINDGIEISADFSIELQRFASLVAAIEREACAIICDSYAENSSSRMNFAENCAEAIRSRK